MIYLNYYYKFMKTDTDGVFDCCDTHLIVIKEDRKTLRRFKKKIDINNYNEKHINLEYAKNNHVTVNRFEAGKKRSVEYYIDDVNYCLSGPCQTVFSSSGKKQVEIYRFEPYGISYKDLGLYSEKDVKNFLLLE